MKSRVMTLVRTFGLGAMVFGVGLAPVSSGCKNADQEIVERSRAALTGASYAPDCNDPDAHDVNCTEPTKDIIDRARANGYEYYVGHAEPTAEFFSRAGASGSNMQWKFKLPATDPAPAQDGSTVANFELYSAIWLGLALCDPNSRPYGACTAASDSNNPSTAGAAFLELQFYPPGGTPFGACSDSQWCVRLHINTLQDINADQMTHCLEPTTEQYLTIDGNPGGPKLMMSNGDTLVVTIRDTPNGLETDVNDVTSSATGSMVASGANGFVHNANQTNCDTTAFDFHPMYATAAPGQTVPWASLRPNVAFDFEIGHFELCGDATCSTLPDGHDADDDDCRTLRGVGGCIAKDGDQDGVSYQASWADGTAVHPGSIVLGSPDDGGVGPLSGSTASATTYNEGYSTIRLVTTEGTSTTFYPFFSQAGAGSSCVFNFGNDLPGTTNDFGKVAQYGTTIDNPCFPGVRETALHYTGASSQDFDDPATLAARLVDSDGRPVTGVSLTFTLGAQSCSASTNASGIASCVVTLNQGPGSYTVTAAFAGDSGHLPASALASFTVTAEESVVTYAGATTSDFHDPVTLSATLSEDGTTPLAGRTLSFILNGTESCTATTDATGRASCSVTPGEPAGAYALTVSFAGDALYRPSSRTVSFTVTPEEDTLGSASSLQVIAQNGAATLSSTLMEDGVSPVAGRTVTITLGSGAGAQSCTGVTSAAGVATCTIAPVTVALGPQPLTDSFVSDGFYQSATHAQQALVFAFLSSGSFVLGDGIATSALASGATVTWWGAQWSKDNPVSGGAAPASFKGFADTITGEPPACGAAWTSRPGNSASPPPASSIPAYMGVLVTSHVHPSGATLAGDAPTIVVVKTQPGYAPNPGHSGTGTVVARACP